MLSWDNVTSRQILIVGISKWLIYSVLWVLAMLTEMHITKQLIPESPTINGELGSLVLMKYETVA